MCPYCRVFNIIRTLYVLHKQVNGVFVNMLVGDDVNAMEQNGKQNIRKYIDTDVLSEHDKNTNTYLKQIPLNVIVNRVWYPCNIYFPVDTFLL